MIKDLVKVASELDRLGLTKEADFIDRIIRKIAVATRDMAPSLNSYDVKGFIENRIIEMKKEIGSDKNRSYYDQQLKRKGIDHLKNFLDAAGEKIFITTENDYTYNLWVEDPLDELSKADPKSETGSIRIFREDLINTIGKEHFDHIKGPARKAGYTLSEIKKSGYGDWQFSGNLDELNGTGYTRNY